MFKEMTGTELHTSSMQRTDIFTFRVAFTGNLTIEIRKLSDSQTYTLVDMSTMVTLVKLLLMWMMIVMTGQMVTMSAFNF